MNHALEPSRREPQSAAPPPSARAAAAAAAQNRMFQAVGSRPARVVASASRQPTSAQDARPAPNAARAAGPVARAAENRAGLGVAATQTPQQRVQACVARLADNAAAVDTLITSLTKVLEFPQDERYRKVNINNRAFQQRVASAPGGMELMHAVGYEPMHGHLVLQSRDLALVWIGKSALEQIRTGAQYQRSKEALELQQALAMSSDDYEVEDATRRAEYLARVPEEPSEGLAGNALICFHVGGEQVWRRFESCNTLEDLVMFARSLPKTPKRDLALSNVTMSPAVPLDMNGQLGLTLQRLDLWPTGHVQVSRRG